ncbi:TRAP transporter large permease subunit [Hydrogenophaga sp.]|jgi:TRAP-type mannitol/chloroaromatic compound transport system permease large subunit|uniref:TRAP transporter large permease n=1 Tax=Hydrogenophaga sp. TaxID=1904254 RepID=UPI002715EB4C|nr:TRAP transporter large permease subunit [Hydrogenophaga sp.]MDO9250779.1 TRAP transporter large permease subunit [Hydrogenophaga sp.]MDP2408022.1 TRAP transporter large permease subunit [Hydrogenophaga sp.]MDP3887459.1 TRAP transporter large permease subunit [Hydrogenophaga sp.]MDZ4177389.1 TRAP transporter large permease subunit [Hydrogenophaga sp.]
MKIRKELWFGFGLMGLILAGVLAMVISAPTMTNGHYGLLMLSLVVVAIMLGFPTAFTLMGMGMLFAFFAYHSGDQTSAGAIRQTLDLMVQRAFSVMSNDVLISIPLFVFMGYLVERANLIEKLFHSLHLSLARVPGSLAVATLVTCAIFATATGIVGAVVTLMGLLAMPQMLRAGYDVRLTAGSITAGGCLGILIPPSVLLIVYGATAGVSVVKLYAGAFFPGLMLAGLYILYVVIIAKVKPTWAPPLSAEQRRVPIPEPLMRMGATGNAWALGGLLNGLKGANNHGVPAGYMLRQLGIVMLPALLFAAVAVLSYQSATRMVAVETYEELQPMGAGAAFETSNDDAGGLAAPPVEEEGLSEPPGADSDAVALPPGAEAGTTEPPNDSLALPPGAGPATQAAAGIEPAATTQPASQGYWIGLGVGALALAVFYGILSYARLEVFKMLLSSFFPLLVLITAVLGSIVFGLATPTEAAAVGALGGFLLAAAYRQLTFNVVKESVFLTAKTSAMVCWLFVGSAIFSAAFALLGGQALVEQWVLGMNLSKTEFLILSQVIIFILGWPLEWTEIIVIFMPIFIPLLDNFGVDPLFFGLLVALNLQTAFLSPPVAMSAFYLKGVAPKHVTLNQIFAGMLPFMGIQVLAIVLLYLFPAIGMWLPEVLYK